MLWQFFVGRFLQTFALIGAVLTIADWMRLGATGLRPGHIVFWSAAAGAVSASITTYRVRRRGCAR